MRKKISADIIYGGEAEIQTNLALHDRMYNILGYTEGDFGSTAQTKAPGGKYKLAKNMKYYNTKTGRYVLGRTMRGGKNVYIPFCC